MHLFGISAIIGLACALAVQAAPAPLHPIVIVTPARQGGGHGRGAGPDRADHRGGRDDGNNRKNRVDHRGKGQGGKGRGGKDDDEVVVVIVVQKIVVININGRHAQRRPQTRVHTYGHRNGGKKQRTRTQYVNRKSIKYITEKPAAPVVRHGKVNKITQQSQVLQEAVEDAAAAEEAAAAERNAALAAGNKAAADDAAQKAIYLEAAKEEALKRLKGAQGGHGAAEKKAAKPKVTKGAVKVQIKVIQKGGKVVKNAADAKRGGAAQPPHPIVHAN